MDQEEGQGSNMHPLLIDVVLEALAKYVRSKDLPSFRLVCKKWNAKIINRFQQESTVRLSDTCDLSQFVQLVQSRYYESTFRNFSIIRIPMNDPELETVFEVCGSAIMGLTLGLAKENIDICQFREVLLQRAPNLQNLSFDTLDGLPEEVTNHSKLFPLWLTQEPSLNVKELRIKISGKQKLSCDWIHQLLGSCNCLQYVAYTKTDGISDSWKVLKPLKDAVAVSSLSYINLGKVENECLVGLSQLALRGLRLKKFHFESLDADCRAEDFSSFLESQKDSLEELTLNEYLGIDDLMVDIPVMANVIKLSFSAFETSQIVPRTPLNYYKSLPNLREVLVYGWQNSIRWPQFFSVEHNLEPMKNVWKLQPPYRMKEMDLFRKLLLIFPQVTSMDITSPSNSILQEIWTSCSSLKILELFLDWNNVEIDRILSGLEQSDCDALRDQMNLMDHVHRSSSIINLRDLHTFVCEMYEPWRDGEPEPEDPSCLLTDASVLGAFCYMPQLHDIYVARSDVTPTSVSFLRNILPYFACINIQGPTRRKLEPITVDSRCGTDT